jgi:hypothetical protein
VDGRTLPVRIAAMADVENGYGAFFVVDFVDNAVVTEAETPALTACQLQATGWPRVNRKLANGVTDSALAFRGKLRQFLLSIDSLSAAHDEQKLDKENQCLLLSS